MPRFFGVGRGPIPAYAAAPSYWPDGPAPAPSEPIGHISLPQREGGTLGYWEAASGIANDEGVMIAESTCSAIFGAELVPKGEALLDYMELTRIALERCSTAHGAVRLMGDLAVKHGFAGNDADLMGAAESLAVVDVREAWVMHVLPDDTGRSAVWAAQRLSHGHAAVVPNVFIIREMVTDGSDDSFLLSPNAVDVAKRNGLWRPGEAFDFAALFSNGEPGQRYYCGRRAWRALSLFAPSLRLPCEYTDLIKERPYPFSVMPDAALGARDLMAIMRDTFEVRNGILMNPSCILWLAHTD